MTDTGWPAPYLQPDRTQDCGFYAQAYLCRCLGYPEITAGQVKAWRAETRYHETRYAPNVLGAEIFTFNDHYNERGSHRIWWLGKGEYPDAEHSAARFWVQGVLLSGWIAQAAVHRVPHMQHAVVLLDADDDGVVLMDPISGHVREPWDWFLGIGPGKYGCHFIEGWYRPARLP